MSFKDRYWGWQSASSVFIVFEAGPTHTGLESAIQLADAAKNAGADAIKFHITDHNKLIADKNLMFTYSILTENGSVEDVRALWDIWKSGCREQIGRRCLRIVKTLVLMFSQRYSLKKMLTSLCLKARPL